jgi:hypothetical protein
MDHRHKQVRALSRKTGKGHRGAANLLPAHHVWSNDITLFVARSEGEAKSQKRAAIARWGDQFPWLRREPPDWHQIDDARELTIRDPSERDGPTGSHAFVLCLLHAQAEAQADRISA